MDDGSTDGSSDICRAYAEKDARIEVIYQENSGVSAARNAGLDEARGEWIAFLDSDDYVSPYYIGDMLTAAHGGCDIAVCHCVWMDDENDDNAPFRRLTHTQHVTGREACIRNLGKSIQVFISCWGKLFRARLWSDLRFPDLRVGEDLFVSYTLLYSACNIAILDSQLYAYVQSGGSVMRSTFAPVRLNKLDAYQEGVRFFNSVSERNLAHIARRVYCSRVFDARCVCKRYIPHERDILRMLRLRANKAYREAIPVRGYIDCSPRKAIAYRLKLFIGRWCLPLYNLLFMRGRTYI